MIVGSYLITVGWGHGIVSTLAHGIAPCGGAPKPASQGGGGQGVAGVVGGGCHVVVRGGGLTVRHVVAAAPSLATSPAAAPGLVGRGLFLVQIRRGSPAPTTACKQYNQLVTFGHLVFTSYVYGFCHWMENFPKLKF